MGYQQLVHRALHRLRGVLHERVLPHLERMVTELSPEASASATNISV